MPLVASGQSLLTGALVVWLTILGYGPIAGVDNPEARALTAQIFVIVLMVTSLTIALSRRQIAETIDRLERSEETLAVRAAELDMVMSRLQDGIAIIEAGGRVVHANDALVTAFGTRPAEPLERVPDADERKGQAFHPDGRPLGTRRTPTSGRWPARSSTPRRCTTSTSTASPGCWRSRPSRCRTPRAPRTAS